MQNSIASKETQPGYSGIAAANQMLNEMIEEAQGKLDLETVKCENFKKEQESLIEQTRQDIAAAQAASNLARAEILRATGEITSINEQLPKVKLELEETTQKCVLDIAALNSQLAILDSDIEVMQTVIEMSSCADKASTSFIQCEHSQKTFVNFAQNELRENTMHLQSKAAMTQVQQTLTEIYKEATGEEKPVMLTQEEISHMTIQEPPTMSSMVNPYMNYSVPDVTPSPEEKSKKCSIKNSPQCERISAKFIRIQSGIIEKRDLLKADLAATEKACEDTKKNLDAQISDFGVRFIQEQGNLATATQTPIWS
jgi:hypothetical protein